MKNQRTWYIFVLVHAFIAGQLLHAAPPIDPRETGYVQTAMHNLRYGTLLAFFSTDNFRIVLPGKLYRANTLPPELLAEYIDRYGIKTILNLRGEHPKKQWWQDEQRVAQSRGVQLINIPCKAHRYPPPEQLTQLLGTFDATKTPVLIHCMKGIDRAGMGTVLWLLEKGGLRFEDAINHLAFLRYGHCGFAHQNRMHNFLQLWHTLRTNYTRDEALQKYTEMYEGLSVASIGTFHRYLYSAKGICRSLKYPMIGLLLAGLLLKLKTGSIIPV